MCLCVCTWYIFYQHDCNCRAWVLFHLGLCSGQDFIIRQTSHSCATCKCGGPWCSVHGVLAATECTLQSKGWLSPSQFDADINQARLTCRLPLRFKTTCVSEGRSWGVLSAPRIYEVSNRLSCSFHSPGWQLSAPWLSCSSLLWIITSYKLYGTTVNAAPLTISSHSLEKKCGKVWGFKIRGDLEQKKVENQTFALFGSDFVSVAQLSKCFINHKVFWRKCNTKTLLMSQQ